MMFYLILGHQLLELIPKLEYNIYYAYENTEENTRHGSTEPVA